MEGGNKYNISLEAGLDTKSNDMLVPVGDPKFQHNWQKYQGHYLPNSLRFEKNGWAAGWNVYNFKFDIKKLPIHDTTRVSTVFVSYSVAFEDTGVYRLSVYDTEDSDVESYSALVVERTNLISSDVDVIVADNVFTGNVAGVPFTMRWDANTKQFEIQSEHNMTADYVNNGDYSTSITVTDNSATFDVDTDIYIPTALSSKSFAGSFGFVSYSEDIYNWGAYTFDGSKITTPENVDVVTFDVTDHKLKFNYTYVIQNVKFITSFDVHNYYTAFTLNRFVNSSYIDSTINVSADNALTFNFMKTNFLSESRVITPAWTNDADEHFDMHTVDLALQLPVWTAVKVNYIDDENFFDITPPLNNLLNGEVCFNDTSLITYRTGSFRLRVQSCFSPRLKTSFILRSDDSKFIIDDIAKYFSGGTFVFDKDILDYRLSCIEKLNDIVKLDIWDPHTVNFVTQSVFIGDSYRFSNIAQIESNPEVLNVIRNAFGSKYTNIAFKYLPDTCFEYNDPFDWEDENNKIYTDKNIRGYRSIKLKGDNTVFDAIDDLDFVYAPETLEHLCKTLFTFDSDYHLYDIDTDEPKSYAELYDVDGKYIGESYIDIKPNYDPSSPDFWPFAITPMFSFTKDGETYKGVYYVDGDTIISGFDDFRSFILGTFDEAASAKLYPPVVANSNYNVTRGVLKYNFASYDFNVNDYNADTISKGFHLVYGDKYEDPVSMFAPFPYTDPSASVDDSFLDFDDIAIETVSSKSSGTDFKCNLSFTEPGIYLGRVSGDYYVRYNMVFKGSYLFALNVEDTDIDLHTSFAVITENENGSVLGSFSVYHGNTDATEYYTESESSGVQHLDVSLDTVNFNKSNVMSDGVYADIKVKRTATNPYIFTFNADFLRVLPNDIIQSSALKRVIKTLSEVKSAVKSESIETTLTSPGKYVTVDGKTYEIYVNYLRNESTEYSSSEQCVIVKKDYVFYTTGAYLDDSGNWYYIIYEHTYTVTTKLSAYMSVEVYTMVKPKLFTESSMHDIVLESDNSNAFFRKIEIRNNKVSYSMNSGVRAVSSTSYMHNFGSNAVYSIPVYGYAFVRVAYEELTDSETFNTVKPVKVTLLDTKDIPGSFTHMLMIDRDVGPQDAKLLHMIESVEFSSLVIDTERSVNAFNVDLITNEDSGFYYAKSVFDDEGNKKRLNYYIPGVAIGEGAFSNTEGNLDYISGKLTFGLTVKPNSVNFIYATSTSEISLPINLNTNHTVIVNNQYDNFMPSITVGKPDVEHGTQKVIFNDSVKAEYILENNKLVSSAEVTAEHIDEDLYDYKVTYPTTIKLDKEFRSSIAVDTFKLYFTDCEATLCALSNTDYTLLSCVDNIIAFTVDSNTILYDITTASIVNYISTDDSVIDTNDGTYHSIKAKVMYHLEFDAVLQAVYSGTINNNIVSFSYNDLSYEVSITDLKKLDTPSVIVESTDIRDPDINHVKYLSTLKLDKDYQLVKQQWNTTIEVENYWWINSDSVLELTQSEFRLKCKNGGLDDWNGDSFDIIATCKRSDIINSSMKYYFVCNQYNCTSNSIFVAVSVTSDTVDFSFYMISELPGIFTHINDVSVPVRNKELGSKLVSIIDNKPELALCSYANITGTYIGSVADWSNTIVEDKYLIIGCHVNNNFNQWALVFSIDKAVITLDKVIQGYGCVGLHGDLTGGQIPSYCFNASYGFTDIVKPLSSLDIVEDDIDKDDINKYQVSKESDFTTIYTSDEKVVGTAGQQWYYKQIVDGIVSHLTFNSKTGIFTKQLLPMTNKYTAIYKSPSFASSIVGDDMVKWYDMAKLFTFDNKTAAGWFNVICGLLGNVGFLLYGPRFAHLVYLQQTLGQYAYVHYNSAKAVPEYEFRSSSQKQQLEMKDAEKERQVLPSLVHEYLFDKQTNKQSVNMGQLRDNKMSLWFALIFSALPAISPAIENLSGKSMLDAAGNSLLTFANELADNFAENASSILASNIKAVNTKDETSWSAVTAVKSLDMFYSTSDNQRIFAGPGFVEHQFVADCVAQSVTDFNVKGRTIQFTYLIKEISEWISKTVVAGVEIGIAAAESLVTANGGGLTAPAAIASSVVAAGLRAGNAMYKCASEALFGILRGVASKVNGSSEAASIVAPHKTVVEGKHKYGEKNETFMWPCFGITTPLKYSDEVVYATYKNVPWALSLNPTDKFSDWNYAHQYSTGMIKDIANISSSISLSQNKTNKSKKDSIGKSGWTLSDAVNDYTEKGDTIRTFTLSCDTVPFYTAACRSEVKLRKLPADMTCIQGVTNFLPNESFMNETIGVSDPAFTTSIIHDYVIDKQWDLAQCCTYGLTQWITVKDTKVTNCAPSNIVVSSKFCGIATPYEAVEVKQNISRSYLRPWAVTPNALALNITGYNAVFDDKVYHAFDGISNRIVSLTGGAGLQKNRQTFVYAIQVNDRFKRSNIVPATELQGDFESIPTLAIDTIDPVWQCVTVAAKEKGLEAGTVGEDKDAVRWSVPVFTESVSTLPAVVKTLTAAGLAVVEGITSLVTKQVTDTNARYKAPLSVDFAIGKNIYRVTNEYICSVIPAEAGNEIRDIIPINGLTYLGASPTEAYFYSAATRCYYTFSGNTLIKVDMLERFRNIKRGYWDFVNQEVVMPSLMTAVRLDKDIKDNDSEIDNIAMPVFSQQIVSGELPPPIPTIFNDRSWFNVISLPSGLAYQGPNRVIINRSIFCDYMLDSIKNNTGKWTRLSRDKYSTDRKYTAKYESVNKLVPEDKANVTGWTYNPFVLVTSPLGLSEEQDCMFEWEITFCWPVEMDLLYGINNFAVVNISGETMTQGGKLIAEPVHVFLTKDLFTRSDNYGYYTFRYQSKNGAGNRERLRIWSDQYIAISSVNCDIKVITTKRTQQLTQQLDVAELKEL